MIQQSSNGKSACGKVSRVHHMVLGESRAIRTLHPLADPHHPEEGRSPIVAIDE